MCLSPHYLLPCLCGKTAYGEAFVFLYKLSVSIAATGVHSHRGLSQLSCCWMLWTQRHHCLFTPSNQLMATYGRVRCRNLEIDFGPSICYCFPPKFASITGDYLLESHLQWFFFSWRILKLVRIGSLREVWTKIDKFLTHEIAESMPNPGFVFCG